MKDRVPAQQELDLNQLQAEERELRQRLNEVKATRAQLEYDRQDSEVTLPPSELIQEIVKRKAHQQLVSKKEDRNIRREHKRGMLLILVLASATAALVWWGLRVMNGG